MLVKWLLPALGMHFAFDGIVIMVHKRQFDHQKKTTAD